MSDSGYGRIRGGQHTNGRGNTLAQKYDLPVEGGRLFSAFNDLRQEYRLRKVTESDEVRGSVVGAGVLESGEELPGSWHQQRNGGTRKWTTAVGEIADATRR